SGKREATTAKGDETFTPTGSVDPKAAIKFRPPTWQELRGLSADERRAILDYFTRINSAPPRERPRAAGEVDRRTGHHGAGPRHARERARSGEPAGHAGGKSGGHARDRA